MSEIHEAIEKAQEGEHGEGFVRIALVENTHRLRQAVRSIRAFLQAGTNQAVLSDAAIS